MGIMKLRFFLGIVLVLIIASSCKKSEEPDDTKENQSPACVIKSPANGQVFFKGDSVLIKADADDDGSITDVRFYLDDIGVGSSINPPYEYKVSTAEESFGTHTVKVIVLDNMGEKSSDEVFIKLSDGAPSADFNASPSFGEPPLSVSFNDLSKNEPTDFFWDFGDGTTSIEKDPSHIYDEAGIYSVMQIISNKYGSDTLIRTNLIIVAEEPAGSYTDPRDGQVYNVLQFGDLSWFGRNLNFETNFSWWYDNNPAYGSTCGRLYTWESALTACPPGWHLPTDDEWISLEIELGMDQYETGIEGWRGTDEGKRMKATSSWDDNGNGTNASGFNAFSTGWHDGEMTSFNMGISTVWWTSTESGMDKSVRRVLRFDEDGVYRNSNWKTLGFSVRCVKDQ